ncbi:MAG TPA: peptidase S10, partial [candidate division Zixibacteria bacterium]|nr:peptidase S10 [candidate division Zixibacteria bacterium]
MTRMIIALCCALALAGITLAEEKKPDSPQEKKAPTEIERIVESTHQVTINGERVEYVARAGTLPLTEDKEDPKASVFFISYTRTGVTDPANRPLTFSFNGGPGSSSVWLHLGLLGPRRTELDDEGFAEGPPFRLVDNEYSLLDKTDLVFIDPVSTGYSRTVGEEDPKQFHGLDEDIESVGEFIRLYTSKYTRWASPKFLIGESYGTTRAAGLSGYLQDQHGLYLNGIMLVSSILNFQTARFDTGNDMPYVLFLPTYTATAWYHNRLEESLQADLTATLAEVKEFALGEYASALMLGDALPADRRAGIVRQLARYTGLSEEYVEQTNLRIHIFRFTKELLRDQRRTVGRLDSRFIGIDADAAGESFEYDPSYANILGPYAATLNDYVRRELNYESVLPYEILTGNVHPWNYGSYRNRYVNVAETLREAMTKNQRLRVYVGSGYYDLA